MKPKSPPSAEPQRASLAQGAAAVGGEPAAASRSRRIHLPDLWKEPFRLFFPTAIAAGLLGVTAWPLHLTGWLAWYPGAAHARLMAHGFFGGFIFGFLATALPRLFGLPSLKPLEAAGLYGLYAAMVILHLLGQVERGDQLFLALMLGFGASALLQWFRRQDVPPPGFILLILAFACGMAGALLTLNEARLAESFFWMLLQPLLYYQGFILLSILGAGGSILPRFFQWPSAQEFQKSVAPPPGWSGKAVRALLAGLCVMFSFVLEAGGWLAWGHFLRFLAVAAYLASEVPFYRAKTASHSLARVLKIGLVLLLAGMLAGAVVPSYRVSAAHVTLMGGAGLILLAVATRVILGHSGRCGQFHGRHGWMTAALGLMLVGMVTRISGDLWPSIMSSHYTYGAIFWSAGLLWWSSRVWPRFLDIEREE